MSQLRIPTILFHIHHWSTSTFGKYKLSHCVDFYIKDVGADELLVNVVLVFADLVIVVLVVTFGGTCVPLVLAVEHSATASEKQLVVKRDFVVVGVRRLLNEGLLNGE